MHTIDVSGLDDVPGLSWCDLGKMLGCLVYLPVQEAKSARLA